MAGTFDTLNDALFAQLDKLQSVNPKDKDALEQTIEQSCAVSQLAGNIIANANTAISLLKYQSGEGMGLSEAISHAPRMLGGGQQ